MIPIILFWVSLFLLAHSYLLYPVLLQILAQKKTDNKLVYSRDEHLPFISIIMSVHNEETAVVEKIRSLYYTLYPVRNFEVLVGSDASTDATNRICKVYQSNYPDFRFFPFNERQGKPAVVNFLVNEAKGDILILTDAKVYFTLDTIFELVKHFKNPEIDIVGGNIINTKTHKDGISIQEKAFMNREISIKHNEGKIWGQTIGVYGAIYAIRKSRYTAVPDGFSVDDFFITMSVLKNKGKAIMNPDAISNEEVPNLITAEFKRKVRISAGNFQNLKYFSSCLLPPWKSLSFAWTSHKVIRWLGPFIILCLYISNLLLYNSKLFYQISFILQTGLLILPFIDFILKKLNVNVSFFRFITHFLAMNAALFAGFIKFLSGRKTNVWQPTRR